MTVTSTLSKYLSGNENAIFCTRAMASKWLRFIFQLPAISGLRATGLLGFFSDCGAVGTASGLLEHCDAGKRLALKVFQRRPTSGRNVGETVLAEVELAYRRGGITAAHHAEGTLGGRADDRLGDALGARGEC